MIRNAVKVLANKLSLIQKTILSLVLLLIPLVPIVAPVLLDSEDGRGIDWGEMLSLSAMLFVPIIIFIFFLFPKK